jgi:hypothetical protein
LLAGGAAEEAPLLQNLGDEMQELRRFYTPGQETTRQLGARRKRHLSSRLVHLRDSLAEILPNIQKRRFPEDAITLNDMMGDIEEHLWWIDYLLDPEPGVGPNAAVAEANIRPVDADVPERAPQQDTYRSENAISVHDNRLLETERRRMKYFLFSILTAIALIGVSVAFLTAKVLNQGLQNVWASGAMGFLFVVVLIVLISESFLT